MTLPLFIYLSIAYVLTCCILLWIASKVLP
jgi:hypothetical protein